MALKRSLSLAAYLGLARRAPKTPPVFPGHRPDGPLVWGHATSPGRIAALRQIAQRLRAQRPELSLLLTTTSDVPGPDKADEGEVWQQLPDDTIAESEAFLNHWRPELCIWTGGYFRPALLSLAAKNAVPMFLVDVDEDGLNAAHRRWLPDLIRANLRSFGAFFARTGAAGQVLRRLGVPREDVEVTGPLQEGGAALGCNESEREEMAQILAGRPVWLAAMAQQDELGDLIEAHKQVERLMLRLLMIIVPDEESEGPDFAEALRDAGLNVAIWSEGELPDEATQVLLADTYGEMGLWYRLAPVTFMASSLVAGPGGRDPYEPAALGSAILYGPHVSRHLGAYSRFAKAGAARIVKDSSGLAAALRQTLAPDRAAVMAAAGWELASEGAEVTDRVVELVQDVLDDLEAR